MPKIRIHTEKVGLHIPAPIVTKPRWSLGIGVGDFIVCSGQPGVDGSGKIVADDIQAQTRQAFENIEAILEEGGLHFGDIVRMRIFVKEERDHAGMSELRAPYYEEHFPDGDFPASTVVVAGRSVANERLLIEVEAIACSEKQGYDVSEVAKWEPSPSRARHGVKAGELLFVSAQAGFDRMGDLVGEDARSQSHQALANLAHIVEAGGLDFSAVAKTTVYLSDPSDYATIVEAWNFFAAERFPNGDFPTLTTAVTRLPVPGMRVAIDAVAATGSKQRVGGDVVSQTTALELPSGPCFSDGIRAGNWVFVSGQGPFDMRGRIVGEGDVHLQARRALGNIEALIEAAGAHFDDIVHVTVLLQAADLYEPFNEVRAAYYAERFPKGDYPAGTARTISTPVLGQLVCLDAIAYVDR